MSNKMESLFDIFGDDAEIKAFNEEQERIAEEINTKESKKAPDENKKKSKDVNKGNSENKKSDAKTSHKKDNKTKIQEECSKSGCEKIIIQVVAEKIHTIEDPEEIKNINLDSFKKIMIEKGFEIFAVMEATWNFAKSEDGTIGFLIATYPQFYAKG